MQDSIGGNKVKAAVGKRHRLRITLGERGSQPASCKVTFCQLDMARSEVDTYHACTT